MKLLFLGSASGISMDPKNFQSNMILFTDNGKKLLIDCGTDIRFSLTKAQYLPQDIDAVYVSHSHADHIGGLEWFAFRRKFIGHQTKPKLIIHEQLAPRLWNNSLSGGLETLAEKKATLHDYFKVAALKEEEDYEWEGVILNLVKTIHIYSNKELMPSYGLTISHQGKNFFISTDTTFTPELFKQYYNKANLIFHDCETQKNHSCVHTHFDQLNSLASSIKAKMWLYHYNDGELPDAKAQGFLGFVRCGQVIELK